MRDTVTVNEITVCEFEFPIKKDLLKKLKDVHDQRINSVRYLRTNFAVSVGPGVLSTQI